MSRPVDLEPRDVLPDQDLTEQFAPLILLCKEAIAQAQKDPSSADKAALRVLDAAPGLLAKIPSDQVPAEIMTHFMDQAALAAMQCAVAFGNKTKVWRPCVLPLARAIDLNPSPAIKARIEANLQIAKRNRVFDGSSPVRIAPPVATGNGIGLKLYFQRDPDPVTRSHVSTYYFVLLFIPIFPICRYRVVKDGSLYRFLARMPLKPFEIVHLGIALLLFFSIVLAIYI